MTLTLVSIHIPLLAIAHTQHFFSTQKLQFKNQTKKDEAYRNAIVANHTDTKNYPGRAASNVMITIQQTSPPGTKIVPSNVHSTPKTTQRITKNALYSSQFKKNPLQRSNL